MEKYLISEAFNNLKPQKILMEQKTTRQQLINELDHLYQKLYDFDSKNVWKVEDILKRNNASEDDSDPQEGMLVTMSNKDLVNSINEIKNLLPSIRTDELISLIKKAITEINSEKIINCISLDDGLDIDTVSGHFIFKLEPVELDNDEFGYADDDFNDYQ